MSKLQKVVTASEQDRIVLSERLEAAKGAITELKKQLGSQGEKVSGLNRVNEDSELRRLELETQIKTNKQVSFLPKRTRFSGNFSPETIDNDIFKMLDASRTNETAAAEKISKLQEEKKVLQVRHRFQAERILFYMGHINSRVGFQKFLPLPENQLLKIFQGDLWGSNVECKVI